MREKAATSKTIKRACKRCSGSFVKSQYCPVDGTKLTEAKEPGSKTPIDPLARELGPVVHRCPLCASELNNNFSFCPHDGEPLYARSADPKAFIQVCPRCSTQWARSCLFCPKDGTPLNLRRTGPEWSWGESKLVCPDCEKFCKGVWCKKHKTILVPPITSDFDRACGGDVLISRETHYLIIKRLRITKSSVLLKAVDLNKSHKKFVFIKVPNVALEDAQLVRKLQRFLRQKRDSMRMRHPNIVKMEGTYRAGNGFPFHVFEYIQKAIPIELLYGKFSTLPLNYFVEIFCQICDALDYAHKHAILHQDLSGNDVLIAPAPEEEGGICIKLTDFGKGEPLIHSDNRDQQLTEVGDFFGHPEYLSPETINDGAMDIRSNVFSLGCIMYLALSEKNPFQAPHWVALFLKRIKQPTPPLDELQNEPELTERVDFIVQRCLAIDPQLRYQNMKEVKAALKALPIASPGKITYKRLRALVLDG